MFVSWRNGSSPCLYSPRRLTRSVPGPTRPQEWSKSCKTRTYPKLPLYTLSDTAASNRWKVSMRLELSAALPFAPLDESNKLHSTSTAESTSNNADAPRVCLSWETKSTQLKHARYMSTTLEKDHNGGGDFPEEKQEIFNKNVGRGGKCRLPSWATPFPNMPLL